MSNKNSKLHFLLLFDAFQQLYDEVQHIMKEWEVLSGQGAPLKEKSDQLEELIHLHERQRAQIRDYEEILYKTIQFHQVKEEVSLRWLSEGCRILQD